MKILVLGATGMLGHKLLKTLSRSHDVFGTVRGNASSYRSHPVLGRFNLCGDTHAEDIDSIIKALAEVRPDVVVNCIGIIKTAPNVKRPYA